MLLRAPMPCAKPMRSHFTQQSQPTELHAAVVRVAATHATELECASGSRGIVCVLLISSPLHTTMPHCERTTTLLACTLVPCSRVVFLSGPRGDRVVGMRPGARVCALLHVFGVASLGLRWSARPDAPCGVLVRLAVLPPRGGVSPDLVLRLAQPSTDFRAGAVRL